MITLFFPPKAPLRALNPPGSIIKHRFNLQPRPQQSQLEGTNPHSPGNHMQLFEFASFFHSTPLVPCARPRSPVFRALPSTFNLAEVPTLLPPRSPCLCGFFLIFS
jgi:hypothetical protein